MWAIQFYAGKAKKRRSWEKAMFILIWTQKINVPTDVTLGILHGAQMQCTTDCVRTYVSYTASVIAVCCQASAESSNKSTKFHLTNEIYSESK